MINVVVPDETLPPPRLPLASSRCLSSFIYVRCASDGFAGGYKVRRNETSRMKTRRAGEASGGGVRAPFARQCATTEQHGF